MQSSAEDQQNPSYDHLRREILVWQERRFTIVSGSISVLFAIFTYVVAHPARWTWTAALSVEFLVVTSACMLSWYAGWGNTIAGAFIAAGSDNPSQREWEAHLGILKKQRRVNRWITMNSVLATIHLLFLGASATMLSRVCEKSPKYADVATTLVLGTLCGVAIAFNVVPKLQYSRELYKRLFQEIDRARYK
jgi:hypothetical protein